MIGENFGRVLSPTSGPWQMLGPKDPPPLALISISLPYSPLHLITDHARQTQVKNQAKNKAISCCLPVWLRVKIILDHCCSLKTDCEEDEPGFVKYRSFCLWPHYFPSNLFEEPLMPEAKRFCATYRRPRH